MRVESSMGFFDDVVRYETDLWNAVDHAVTRDGGVGLGALQALRVIQRYAPACRVHELSRDLGITIGAASKLVDRLERDRLAIRTPHPDDRRSSLVVLTTEGRDAHDACQRVAEYFVAQAIAGEDVAGFASMLAALQSRLHVVRENG